METTRDDDDWALVLAGGDGTRLQELTRQICGRPIPKQYCRIDGRRSLLEATLERIAPAFSARRTLAIVSRAHLALARPQLRRLPAENVVVQAHNLDTGPGMIAPLREIARRDRDALVSVFPSDHFVADAAAFRACVARARAAIAARPERIALIGIRPEWAEPGYGYVERGAAVAGVPGVFGVRCFREKPTPDVARDLVARGALWNSFVLVFRAARVLELAAEVAPAGETRAWNFSSELLARIPQHLLVLEAAGIGWSDWGTREAIERTFAALKRVPPWLGGQPDLQPAA